MILSKVQLRPSHQASAALAKLNSNGVYASHQLLWRLFPSETKRRFLYREEMDKLGHPQFFVLSKNQPIETPLFSIQSKPFAPQLAIDDLLAFKLRVNPTICPASTSGKKQRHDVLMHAKYQNRSHARNGEPLNSIMYQAAIDWLANAKRMAEWGIQLASEPKIIAYNQHQSKKRNGHKVQFSSVDIEGLLHIKCPEKFWQHYQSGFGRAKSMGCGLMLVRRIV